MKTRRGADPAFPRRPDPEERTASVICRIYDVPGATLDQYNQVDQQLGSETPDGAHLHIAGPTDDGFRVIEVWDSADHIDRFVESGLAQAMQDARIPEPTITEFEVHKLDWVN
jgi:hypothetical protein